MQGIKTYHVNLPEQVKEEKRKSTMQTITSNPVLWASLLVFQVFLYSSFGILINLSSKDGHVTFQSSSFILNIEIVKMFFSALMTWPEVSSSGVPSIHVKHILPFAVPALCYCFTNNISVFMQEEMDPATFQVLCNLKIVSTAILYRIFIRRRLTRYQWLSLALLTFAGAINGLYGLMAKTTSLQEIHVTLLGLVMTLLYCLTSGFAGVYTEYILKKNAQMSLAFQNCFMYIFGISLNLFMWTFQSDRGGSLFRGYTVFTWGAIVTQALNGLMMSLVMKHSSNIIRLFVIASAIPVTTLLSMFIFNLEPGFPFVIVIALVLFAIYLYNL